MDSCFKSAVSGTPPDAPSVPLIGHPQSGNPALGQQATKPGPWWYYMMTQELRNIILAAGLVPSALDLNQVLDALQVLFAPNGRPGHAYTDADWAPIGGGLVLQWGKGTYANAATVTLPVAHLHSNILVLAGIDAEFAGENIELVGTASIGLSTFKIYPVTSSVGGGAWSPATAPCWWLSLGR